MKSVATHTTTEPIAEYPYLCEFDDGDIILFTKPNTGMVVKSGTNSASNPIGKYLTDWGEKNGKRFEGTVTLSN